MRIWIAVAAVLAMTGGASAASVVKVKLGDPAGVREFALQADQTSVKAGAVAFEVTNLSKSMVHE